MSDKIVKPKIGPTAILKNLPMFYNMWRARNPNFIENSINKIEHLDKALYPTFEGIGKPVDVLMIYLMFNSEGKDSVLDIDTVTRVWCINTDFNLYVFDNFIISTKFPNQHIKNYYTQPIFNRLTKNGFHRGLSVDNHMFEIDGEWNDKYKYSFDYTFPNNLNLKANNLEYRALDQQGVLVYANGKKYFGRKVDMKFYEAFYIGANGSIFANDKEIPINNGRGHFEHGIGIFGTGDLEKWEWWNLQFENGAMHFFDFPTKIRAKNKNYNIFPGEGAYVMNGKWNHLLKKDYTIEGTKFEFDRGIKNYIPIEWEVKGPNFELYVKTLSKSSWKSYREHDHNLVDYLVEGEGNINGEYVKTRGTKELLFINNLYGEYKEENAE